MKVDIGVRFRYIDISVEIKFLNNLNYEICRLTIIFFWNYGGFFKCDIEKSFIKEYIFTLFYLKIDVC